ncbi:hypothetical protein [Winogradskyella sp.]|uniref:hypothetical protein n=1 Tax=Winogradskyella sp. TaxID=1883156 RepID=UPI003F6AA69A
MNLYYSITIQKLKLLCLNFIVISLIGCSSDDDCTKTITIPQVYLVGNQYYYNNIEQEVDCDFPEPEEPELVEPPRLENFTYEVLSLVSEINSENNTYTLQFDVQLNNNNNFDVEGLPYFTMFTNIEFSTASYINNASNACLDIPANSNCIFSYGIQEPLTGAEVTDNFEILNVEYIITN